MSTLDSFEWSKIVEAFACNARVEGMKAENTRRLANGCSLAYNETAFAAEASMLGSIAGLLLERSRYG